MNDFYNWKQNVLKAARLVLVSCESTFNVQASSFDGEQIWVTEKVYTFFVCMNYVIFLTDLFPANKGASSATKPPAAKSPSRPAPRPAPSGPSFNINDVLKVQLGSRNRGGSKPVDLPPPPPPPPQAEPPAPSPKSKVPAKYMEKGMHSIYYRYLKNVWGILSIGRLWCHFSTSIFKEFETDHLKPRP